MKLLLDCDTGIDDALAILYLAKSPVTLLGVGTVHGNVGAIQAAFNTVQVLRLADLDVPVAYGELVPLAQELRLSPIVHGEDGLAGKAVRMEGGSNPTPDAVDQLIRLARENRGEIALLATGPLTNLARAVTAAPDIADAFASVVIMGGAVSVKGNVSPVAEANIFHDPEAADIVFGLYKRVVLVPLDVTMTVQITALEIEALKGSEKEAARFAGEILHPYWSFYRNTHGIDCALHDPLAALLTVEPDLATDDEYPIFVELSGALTRGMTVAERRQSEIHRSDRPLVRVATSVDVRGAAQRIMDAILA